MKIQSVIFLIVLSVSVCGCLSTTPPAPPTALPGGPSNVQSGNFQPGISNESFPNLIGRWTGLTAGHVQGSGFYSHYHAIYNITGQQGYAFAGNKEYIRPDGKTYYENFSGAISPGGEMIFADSRQGYSIGRMTGPDSMDILTGQDGTEARAFVQIFTRQKQ